MATKEGDGGIDSRAVIVCVAHVVFHGDLLNGFIPAATQQLTERFAQLGVNLVGLHFPSLHHKRR